MRLNFGVRLFCAGAGTETQLEPPAPAPPPASTTVPLRIRTGRSVPTNVAAADATRSARSGGRFYCDPSAGGQHLTGARTAAHPPESWRWRCIHSVSREVKRTPARDLSVLVPNHTE
jgi:hypothetical protein